MQMEGVLRYKIDGAEPQFWEVKAKLVRCVCVYVCFSEILRFTKCNLS